MAKTSRKSFKSKALYIVFLCLGVLALIILLFFLFSFSKKCCDALCYANRGLENYSKGKYNQAVKYFTIAIKNDTEENYSIDDDTFLKILAALADVYGPEKLKNWKPKNSTGENSDFLNNMLLYAPRAGKFLNGVDIDNEAALTVIHLLPTLDSYDPFTVREFDKYILNSLGGNAQKRVRHILYLAIYSADEKILNLNDGYLMRMEQQTHDYKYLQEMLDMASYDVVLNGETSWSTCRKGITEFYMGDYSKSAWTMDACVNAINSKKIQDDDGQEKDLDVLRKATAYYFLYLTYYNLGYNSNGIISSNSFAKTEEAVSNFIEFCNNNSPELDCDYNSAYYIRGDACMNDGRERLYGDCAMIWEEGIGLGYDIDGSLIKAYNNFY